MKSLMLRNVALNLAMALALVNTLHAATYEVAQQAPQASDAAPGTSEKPWKTISRAAEMVKPGDLVIIHGGIYRERVLIKNSGTAIAPIRFEAGSGEYVVITGADRITDWQRSYKTPLIYQTPWPHKFITWNQSMTHPNDEYHQVIGRCEQILADGYLLRQVLNASQLAPGTFYVDMTNQTLFVRDIGNRDVNKVFFEASVRQEILNVEGDYIQLRGIRFRYAANMAQQGAVKLAGRCNTMEDCIIESVNASGATFTGEDAVVSRCTFRDNGQIGFGANRAHRLLFTECLVENNNTKGFDRGWEAGGNKLALCRDVILERSRFVRNRGNGIWFDIGNTNCVVRNCLIANNEDAGIFYEISFRLLAHDNVIVGNGFAPTLGAWGAQAGISLSSSPSCVIERNLIVGNREGFNFREQERSTPTIENRSSRPVWNHDELIRHNIIVLNREAQVWGWFDVKDNRHWPVSGNGTSDVGKTYNIPEVNSTNAVAVSTNKIRPQELSLEKLHLQFEDNIYFAAPGQGWINWGVKWARRKSYTDLRAFQSELGIDTRSYVLNPGFADITQGDFRLSLESMNFLKACYPKGSIPGVQLGIK